MGHSWAVGGPTIAAGPRPGGGARPDRLGLDAARDRLGARGPGGVGREHRNGPPRVRARGKALAEPSRFGPAHPARPCRRGGGLSAGLAVARM